MKFALPWATSYGCFSTLGGLGPAWWIFSFQMSKSSLVIFVKSAFGNIINDEEEDLEEQVWTWDLSWKGEADEGPCLHHDPNSLFGASEIGAKPLGYASECDHKSGDESVVTIHADEWRMPWAHLPRVQVPSTDAPEVAGLASLTALTFAGRLGALWGHHVQESRSCCSSMFSLKILPGGFLIRTQLCPLNPLKAAGGISSLSPAAERSWGSPSLGAAPPSPVLGSWEQSEGDTGAQSSCRQESPGSSASLWVLPGPEGPSQSMGARVRGPSGPGTLESWVTSCTFPQAKVGGSVEVLYVSNSN